MGLTSDQLHIEAVDGEHDESGVLNHPKERMIHRCRRGDDPRSARQLRYRGELVVWWKGQRDCEYERRFPFAVRESGVDSVGHTVRVQPTATDRTPPLASKQSRKRAEPATAPNRCTDPTHFP